MSSKKSGEWKNIFLIYLTSLASFSPNFKLKIGQAKNNMQRAVNYICLADFKFKIQWEISSCVTVSQYKSPSPSAPIRSNKFPAKHPGENNNEKVS
jgi:hypothetical protein